MALHSDTDPQDAENGTRNLKLASPDMIPQKLWKEAVASYFDGEYLSAVIGCG